MCKADPSIERVHAGSFVFPLGVYPVEELKPVPGYTLQFEAADGDNEGGDWEEWPDRYVFDAVVSADRLESLCRGLIAMLPGRVYPILDVLGRDAYREIDPYISYDLLGLDALTDALRRYRDFFFEDGLCGFGAMSEEPFLYLFVDEHKILTIRAEPTLKEKVEKLLHAYDLEEHPEPAGVDSVAHEHRDVLLTASKKEPHLLGFDQIVEVLRDQWRLVLNVDAETNLDQDNRELGTTSWRCVVRLDPPQAEEHEEETQDEQETRYAEVLLGASCLRQAEEQAAQAALELLDEDDPQNEPMVISADRLTPEQLAEVWPQFRGNARQRLPENPEELLIARWIDG